MPGSLRIKRMRAARQHWHALLNVVLVRYRTPGKTPGQYKSVVVSNNYIQGFSSTDKHVRQGNGVDLLVTDYHLSRGELGTQVLGALRECLGARLKAVLVTGDTSSAIKHLPRDPHLRVASKPIDAGDLLALLRALLAA